jgi:hypothetical protein
LGRQLISKKKLCLFFEDVMNMEVLDGRDVVNTGEEAEGKPLSSVSLDVFTTLTDSYRWSLDRSLDERNRAAFMDCSHSGVGATRFASAVQYEHAMKRPCDRAQAEQHSADQLQVFQAQQLLAQYHFEQFDPGRQISGLRVLYVM